MGQEFGEQQPNDQADKSDGSPLGARSDTPPIARRQAKREAAEERATRQASGLSSQACCVKVTVKMESAAHPKRCRCS
ncbi:unnamed protein product [Ectocarpus fasciculatus]